MCTDDMVSDIKVSDYQIFYRLSDATFLNSIVVLKIRKVSSNVCMFVLALAFLCFLPCILAFQFDKVTQC